jgi:tetratricopeptide (TPR) repeat protein
MALSSSPPARRLASTLAALLLAASSLAELGCGTSPGPTPRTAQRTEQIKVVNVRDEDFSASVFGLLKKGEPSAARDGMLVGVVRRQLAHAERRFSLGAHERATASVVGAMYLARAGEGRSEMIDAVGASALSGAIARLSARGDEGRALAFMQMRSAALPKGSPERNELEENIRVLQGWMRETRTGKPIRRLGAEERALVARSLVDPSPEALRAAAKGVSDWIDAAIDFHAEFRQTGERPAREDAVEAARALESGAVTLVALFLRHGDARGALETINQTSAKRVIPPELHQQIAAAATDGGARDWQGLAGMFAQLEEEPGDMETGPDPALLGSAVWGASLEAYRKDPSSLGASILLSQSLIELGLSEAAPHVLAEALGSQPDPRAVAASIELVMAGMNEDASIEDIDAARRTFRAASAVLAIGDKPEMRGRIDPTPGRARFMMASIELRSGNLAAARPLLEAAVSAEPSVGGSTMLAMVERQAGESARAIQHVEQALKAPDARSSPGDVAEALILAFEVHRDAGSQEKAKAMLDTALEATLAARSASAGSAARARAERLLGRVLDGYGDAKGAARALERALQAAGSERPLLGATVLDAVGRAFVRRDVGAARAALKQGIEGDLGEDELVYAGLWLMFLERDLKVPTDGTAERALRVVSDRGSWVGKLAAWASGKLSDAELATAAQSTPQRVEAAFYTAVARKVAGDPGAEAKLREVAKSPVIDLLEVHIAREMLAPRLRAELPGGVKLP